MLDFYSSFEESFFSSEISTSLRYHSDLQTQFVVTTRVFYFQHEKMKISNRSNSSNFKTIPELCYPLLQLRPVQSLQMLILHVIT